MTITVEHLFPSGMFLLSTIYRGQYVKCRYGGHTLKEAKRLFRTYLKTL